VTDFETGFFLGMAFAVFLVALLAALFTYRVRLGGPLGRLGDWSARRFKRVLDRWLPDDEKDDDGVYK
jgi:hypothetical protein